MDRTCLYYDSCGMGICSLEECPEYKQGKPILFSTPMIKEILKGRKTQTRRIIKPKSKNACGFYVTHRQSDNAFTGVYDYDENESMFDNPHTPPCEIGDTLWVRETWCNRMAWDGGNKIIYKADIEDSLQHMHKWKPSIHMPRSAARLFLKVTDVRVEQLRDITEDGAKAEGIRKFSIVDAFSRPTGMYVYGDTFEDTAKEAFKRLWAGIYGKWINELWVWVIEFERR